MGIRGQDVFHGGCNGRAVRIFLDIQVLDAFAVSDAAVARRRGVLGNSIDDCCGARRVCAVGSSRHFQGRAP